MTQIAFTTDRFLPLLPEDCQANPGAYGFELALWLAQTLLRSGIVTSYPLGEDWGWFVEYIEGEAEFMIGCGSQCDAGEGYLGQPVTWHVFVQQSLSFVQRLKGRGGAPEIQARLSAAIVAALRAEGIESEISAGG